MGLICKTFYFQKGLLSLEPEGMSVWHCLWHGPWIDDGQTWFDLFNKQGFTSRNLGALPPGNASCIPPAPDWERQREIKGKYKKRWKYKKGGTRETQKAYVPGGTKWLGEERLHQTYKALSARCSLCHIWKGCFDIINEHFQENFWLRSLLTFKDRDLLKGVADTELV